MKVRILNLILSICFCLTPLETRATDFHLTIPSSEHRSVYLYRNFEYNLRQKKDQAALKNIDEILKHDLDEIDARPANKEYQINICSMSPHIMPRQVLPKIRFACVKHATYKNGLVSKKVLNKILAKQKLVYFDDDQRIALTLKALGDCSLKIHEYPEAAKFFKESFTILSLYYGKANALKKFGSNYGTALEKSNNTDELEKLINIKPNELAQLKVETAEAVPKREDYKEEKKYLKARKEFYATARNSELDQLLTRLQCARNEAKYGHQTMITLIWLQNRAKRCKNWKILYPVTEEYLNLQIRMGEKDYDVKLKQYELLVKSASELNDLMNAEYWLKIACDTNPHKSNPDYLIRIALMCVECKKFSKAKELIEKEESRIQVNHTGLRRIEKIRDLWRQMGDEERTSAAQKRRVTIYQTVYAKSLNAMKQKRIDHQNKNFESLQKKVEKLKSDIALNNWDAVMSYSNTIDYEYNQISWEQRDKYKLQILDVVKPLFTAGNPLIAERVCTHACLQPSHSQTPLILANKFADISEIIAKRELTGHPVGRHTFDYFMRMPIVLMREEKNDVAGKIKLQKRMDEINDFLKFVRLRKQSKKSH